MSAPAVLARIIRKRLRLQRSSRPSFLPTVLSSTLEIQISPSLFLLINCLALILMETEPDYLEAPPPAYSEQEFDQKVSLATAISTLTPVVDEEGWEQYDPRAFEGNAANPMPIGVVGQTATSSSSTHDFPSKGNHSGKSDLATLPSITPLRIEKKFQPKPYEYEYTAGGDTSKNDMERIADSSSSMPPTGRNGQIQGQGHYTSGFVDNELHALHYKSAMNQEEILVNNVDFDPAVLYSSFPHTRQTEIQSASVDPYQSQPPMPLYTPERDLAGGYPPVLSNPNLHPITQPDAYRRSLPPTPTLPRHQGFLGERPVTSYQPTRASFLNFDPAVAYGKTSVSSAMQAQLPVISKSEIQYDPHSLYSSAVSSQLGPLKGIQHQYSSTPPQNQKQHPNQTVQQSIQYLRPSPHFIDTSQTLARNQPYMHATAGIRPDSTYFASNSPRPSTTSITRYSQYPDTSF